MRYIALSALIALAACTKPDVGPPAIEIRTIEVEKPVPVACVKEGSIPAEPAKVGNRLNGKAAHDADILAGSALQLRQWGRELMALIRPCTKP